MRTNVLLVVLAVLATFALTAAGPAVAVGPWPDLVASVSNRDGTIRYSAAREGVVTRVTALRVSDRRVLHVATVPGAFGVPAVTVMGQPGGLSTDGRTLVLSERPSYGAPRTRSSFVIVSTADFRVRTISLRGDFGYDALSPNGRMLYLVQHRSLDEASYSVRAYDLRTDRLLTRIIADKSELETTMRGFPVARATSGAGTWVYTLYRRASAKPFIHALNARAAYAVCIDLPRQVPDEWIWNASLELTDGGTHLVVRLKTDPRAFTIDTRTMRVVAT